MIISNLEFVESVREDEKIEGGIAFADAFSSASANGPNFASAFTDTFTNAYSNNYYYYGSSASAGSRSSSAAS